jgi:molecular chaperone GrpE (heat shock protein)
MAHDLHVDIQDLEQFIQSLKTFQNQMTDKFRALELAWKNCDESWEGEAKQKFEKEITPTIDQMRSSLQEGEEAVLWLQKFHEKVEEFERG